MRAFKPWMIAEAETRVRRAHSRQRRTSGKRSHTGEEPGTITRMTPADQIPHQVAASGSHRPDRQTAGTTMPQGSREVALP
jgi:hypothetical protein